MSRELALRVLASSDITGSPRLLLTIMAILADASDQLEESIVTLAELAQLRPETARRILRRLRADGWIRVVRRGGGRRPNRYQLLTPA